MRWYLEQNSTGKMPAGNLELTEVYNRITILFFPYLLDIHKAYLNLKMWPCSNIWDVCHNVMPSEIIWKTAQKSKID